MIEAVYEEMDLMEKNLSSFVFAQKYQYANLCVKASGEALLTVKLEMGSRTLHIEDMAIVAMADDYTLHVLPRDEEYIPLLRLKILEQHPEFKVKLVDSPYPPYLHRNNNTKLGDDESLISLMNSDRSKSTIKEKILVVGMPDIDKDRFNLFDKAIDIINDNTIANIERQCLITARIAASELNDSPDNSIDEIKKKIEDSRDFNLELCQQTYDTKKSDLQEAYDYYCTHGERELCLKPCIAEENGAEEKGTEEINQETEVDDDSDQQESISITSMTFE